MVTKVLGDREQHGTGGVQSTGNNSSHGHIGTVVYQISAEDAALDTLIFDMIMTQFSGSPNLYTVYGSIFTGFLVG